MNYNTQTLLLMLRYYDEEQMKDELQYVRDLNDMYEMTIREVIAEDVSKSNIVIPNSDNMTVDQLLQFRDMHHRILTLENMAAAMGMTADEMSRITDPNMSYVDGLESLLEAKARFHGDSIYNHIENYQPYSKTAIPKLYSEKLFGMDSLLQALNGL